MRSVGKILTYFGTRATSIRETNCILSTLLDLILDCINNVVVEYFKITVLFDFFFGSILIENVQFLTLYTYLILVDSSNGSQTSIAYKDN